MDSTIPSAFQALFLQFQPVFTAPSFCNFVTLVTGWILCTGRHTISRVIQHGSGPEEALLDLVPLPVSGGVGDRRAGQSLGPGGSPLDRRSRLRLDGRHVVPKERTPSVGSGDASRSPHLDLWTREPSGPQGFVRLRAQRGRPEPVDSVALESAARLGHSRALSPLPLQEALSQAGVPEAHRTGPGDDRPSDLVDPSAPCPGMLPSTIFRDSRPEGDAAPRRESDCLLHKSWPTIRRFLEEVAQGFSRRWAQEVLHRDTKQALGLEDPQNGWWRRPLGTVRKRSRRSRTC